MCQNKENHLHNVQHLNIFRGKMLDVFPDYRKEAEDHLSKAVSKIEF